ncbi:hypothetical protein FACS1894200_12380 [Spirochaetia bacterium]|nr:hypothetical protein FACS1894200_12380 [Spirochaetia bacterium]
MDIARKKAGTKSVPRAGAFLCGKGSGPYYVLKAACIHKGTLYGEFDYNNTCRVFGESLKKGLHIGIRRLKGSLKSRDRELRLTGRAKDTIVLRSGENVEPVPIEKKLQESDWIRECIVLGQDQKYLAALIVPIKEAVMRFAEENI